MTSLSGDFCDLLRLTWQTLGVSGSEAFGSAVNEKVEVRGDRLVQNVTQTPGNSAVGRTGSLRPVRGCAIEIAGVGRALMLPKHPLFVS